MTIFLLKIIGLIFMTIDHVGAMLGTAVTIGKISKDLSPSIFLLRILGRLSFPLFAFSIGVGLKHTKNIKKYCFRLFLFGFFNFLALEISKIFLQNNIFLKNIPLSIFFTFGISALIIFLYNNFTSKINFKNILILILGIIFSFCFIYFLKPDYGFFGAIIPIAIYFSKNKSEALLFLSLFLFFIYGTTPLFIASLFSFIFIGFYNNKKGASMKYFFYTYYIGHIIFLGIIFQIFYVV